MEGSVSIVLHRKLGWRTIPRTPQQNGVAKHMNRTLKECARSMRLHAGLPKTLWADAISTAAYLIN